MSPSPRVVILDNYDSFAYNLFQRVGELTGVTSTVVRNDRATLAEIAALRPTHVIVSPGPGSPENPAYFGVCRDVILELGKTVAVLGVCLGHQGVAVAFGARIARAPRVMHGKTSPVFHDGSHLFRGIDSPAIAMRYHSLVVDPSSIPSCLMVNARTDDGVVMGIVHRDLPIHGVQFHPESIGTPCGTQILANFFGLVSPGQPVEHVARATWAGHDPV